MQKFLHWRTDPLLIDPEPMVQNKWLTANDLIESGQREKIFTSTGQFQLYSIMVRKTDFISRERLLQSFPYIVLDEERMVEIRKKTLFLAEKAHNYFQETPVDYNIRSWQKRLIKYLEEQKRLPFPLFRLYPDWLKIFHNKQFLSFQSARGENFQLPLFLTEDLAYLSGVVMGDGHLANYFINIIDSSKEHIENLSKLLINNFNSKTEFFKQSNANAWNVNLLGKWIVRFFNFFSSQPINQRKYPFLRESLIFQGNGIFRRAFWRGLMDADGSYKSTILFGSASKRLIIDFESFLLQNGINFRNYKQEVFGGITYSISILGKSRKDFTELIGTVHPQKSEEITELLSRRVNRFSQRPHTLFKQGTWEGRVKSFREDKLLSGFFDFSRINNFCVINMGDLLLEMRGKQTQEVFTEKLPINQGMLSQYERNEIAIPITILSLIFTQANYSIEEFYRQNPRLSIRVRKSKCTLDTQPNKFLLMFLRGIQIKDSGYFLFIGTESKSLGEYKEEFCSYFSIRIPEKRLFRNAVLYSFIKKFFSLK